MTSRTGNKFNDLVDRAIEMGAEKAAIIKTDTVAVAEWVQWKCRYGCRFYGKDAYHPPHAPTTKEMEKMLKEYSQALLINSSNGTALTKIALAIENEACQMGYYKAFALIALPLSEGST
ncbi:MAG: hypothetical protein APF76_16290 [Desulfitibacter sp. BRH_c19]|nr:MAG: hypothetical protein APF76_16290 [Desulfitibacter sp. BRH_c19]